MLVVKRLVAFAVAGTAALVSGAALAQDGGTGQPHPWQLGLQQGVTPVMDNIIWFHNFLLWLIFAITLFVLVLLMVVIVRYNARSNPVPSRTTHNTLIELAWTVVPVLILVAVAVPSFRLLFLELYVPQADLTIKRDRQAVVLELRLPRPEIRIRLDHGAAERSQTRSAAPAHRR
jgi:cytochrome c oxidase subunit 2